MFERLEDRNLLAVITFDPDGGGSTPPITDLTGLDWVPGNALADGGNLAVAAFMADATKTVVPGFATFYTGGTQIPFATYFRRGSARRTARRFALGLSRGLRQELSLLRSGPSRR